jgi:hypothetical protein
MKMARLDGQFKLRIIEVNQSEQEIKRNPYPHLQFEPQPQLDPQLQDIFQISNLGLMRRRRPLGSKKMMGTVELNE